MRVVQGSGMRVWVNEKLMKIRKVHTPDRRLDGC
jgi:hypothetical protein